MINCEGIKAFRGSMVYDPPNPRGYKELKGEFIHKQFGDEGYWYDGWSSYDDRFCRDIQEEPDVKELISEIEKRLEILWDLVVAEDNASAVEGILEDAEAWLVGVKEMVVSK